MNRKHLPQRRRAITIGFEHNGQKFHATFGLFEDDLVAEVFVNSSQKSGSEADVNASDAAIAVSLALQYGCPLNVVRRSLRRDTRGEPMGALSRALDLIAKEVEAALS